MVTTWKPNQKQTEMCANKQNEKKNQLLELNGKRNGQIFSQASNWMLYQFEVIYIKAEQ